MNKHPLIPLLLLLSSVLAHAQSPNPNLPVRLDWSGYRGPGAGNPIAKTIPLARADSGKVILPVATYSKATGAKLTTPQPVVVWRTPDSVAIQFPTALGLPQTGWVEVRIGGLVRFAGNLTVDANPAVSKVPVAVSYIPLPGIQGLRGLPGLPGIQGPIGMTGPQGIQGIPASTSVTDALSASIVTNGTRINALSATVAADTAYMNSLYNLFFAGVPTLVSQLTNDAGYQTATQVASAVNAGVSSITPGYTGNAQIIYDGNSLWAGTGSSHVISSPTDFAAGPFPSQTRTALITQFSSATFTSYNFGVPGQRTTAMIADASTQIDALFNPTTFSRQIVVCGEITNAMADGGVSSTQAIADYVSYCKGRRAKGFLVVATTVLPRTTNLPAITAAEFETRRTAVNDYIRLRYLEFADVLADIASLSGLTYPDGTHTNDAGYVLIGNLVASKVGPLLVTGFNPQSIPLLLSGTTSTTTTTPTSATGVILSLRGQGANNSTTITDDAGHTITALGNAKISTTQFKFGTSSIFLDGTTNTYLTTPTSPDWDFGTGDWCIEAWIYKTGAGIGFPGLISRGDNAANQWTWAFTNASTKPDLYVNSGTTNYVNQNLASPTGITLNTWTHVALVSSGGVRKMYLNGTLNGTATVNSTMELNNVNKQLAIGGFPAINNGTVVDVFPGYMHLLVTKSAKYTANFTPPTSF